MPSAGWPSIFELSVGQGLDIDRSVAPFAVRRRVTLLDVAPTYDVMRGLEVREGRIVTGAVVTVDVDGETVELLHRPYEMPRAVNGLRLFVEAVRATAGAGEVAAITDLRGDARLACVAEGESWGPAAMRFPIRDYRWRSSSYNNTWLSIVPQPHQVYIHRGEDYGAVPDRLPVQAILPGRVLAAPAGRPEGSNTVVQTVAPGVEAVYAHMNLGSLTPSARAGRGVEAGDTLDLTGATWQGRESQTNDPHLHFGLSLARDGGRTPLATCPYAVEAYLRDFNDPVLPVAGGYGFALAGEAVTLDGSRSLARPGRRIAAMEWRLADGTTHAGPVCRTRYDAPGFYCEELAVRSDDGTEDRDFAHVRVFAEGDSQPAFCGFLLAMPARGLTPGREATFCFRPWLEVSGARLDFGDGTAPVSIEEDVRHRYIEEGIYTATVAGRWEGQPVCIKVRMVVGDNAAADRKEHS